MSENIEKKDRSLEALHEDARKVEQTMKDKNIYYLATLDKLAALEDEIAAVSLSVGLDISRTIQEAQITSPSDMLDQAIDYWDERLQAEALPSENELVRKLQEDFQLKVKRAKKSYIPSDDLDLPLPSEESSPRLKKNANRVALALKTLLHMEIGGTSLALDNIEVSISKIQDQSSRSRPYWAINLKKHGVVILLNNQYENRTFVLNYSSKADLERVVSLRKQNLKLLDDKTHIVYHFPFHDEEQFTMQLLKAVQKVVNRIEQLKPYETYEEAQEAAQNIGIKGFHDYRDRRDLDSRLPKTPHTFYKDKWNGWHDFLGKEKKKNYETYEEAKMAVRRLKIRSQREYNQRYKEDPLLSASPYQIYDDFVDWGDYLRDEPNALYSTYAEAQAAARALGATGVHDYVEKRKHDRLLPFNPAQKYADDWTSWYDFLEIPTLYKTYEEARSAAKNLNCHTLKEYHLKHKQDPQLPYNPQTTYCKDWKGWDDYLGR